MATTMNVLWIDDMTKEREINANALRTEYLKIKVFHPSDPELEQLFKKQNSPFDLYIVDFKLSQKGFGDKGKYPHGGLTYSGLIRDKYPEHPVYVISESNVIKKEYAFLVHEFFDDVLSLVDVVEDPAKGREHLYNDAIDYMSLRASKKKNPEELLKLLNAPESSREVLLKIMTNELQQGVTIPFESPLAFAKWLKFILLIYPGPLYNKTYAATKLGLDVRAFEGVSERLKEARYAGIFSKSHEELWWSSELNRLILLKAKEKQIDFSTIQEIASKAFDIPDGIAKCAKCKEKYPDTVATEGKNLFPVHYRCSKPRPQGEQRLYFEEPRVMK